MLIHACPPERAHGSTDSSACRLFHGVQEDVEQSAFVVGGVIREIFLDVVDGFGQDVQAVLELVELGARDDQLVLAEAQLGAALAGFVVPLAARSFAELARAARAGASLERASAPPTTARSLGLIQ